ncbi:hypothetical protein [Humidisolicoccus flavus]
MNEKTWTMAAAIFGAVVIVSTLAMLVLVVATIVTGQSPVDFTGGHETVH